MKWLRLEVASAYSQESRGLAIAFCNAERHEGAQRPAESVCLLYLQKPASQVPAGMLVLRAWYTCAACTDHMQTDLIAEAEGNRA